MILTRYPAGELPSWANDPMEEEPMIEPRSILIDAGNRQVRVLRLCGDGMRCNPLRYTVDLRTESMCKICGCTDRWGCVGGCGWVDAHHTVCSRCYERLLT